ncbi:NUDIX domain-containing protein [Candidatus Dojkabacteria bacterium]|nr:NUDIX domain-containing protein [Candidatus Dojkabacteria bacterium]
MPKENLQNIENKEPSSEEIEYVAVINNEGEVEFEARDKASNPENDLKRLIIGLLGFTRNEEGEDCMILQRRSRSKKEYPDHLTFAASGHINPEDLVEDEVDFIGAMARELNEEMGITTIPSLALISSFESREQKEGYPDIRKEMMLGVTQIELSQLENFTTTDEVSSYELIPWEKVLTQVMTDPEDREEKYKFTIPFEQSILHLVDTADALMREP